MTSSVLEEYQNLLGDHTEDEILCWAVEESRKHFDQVEAPRLTQIGSEGSTKNAELLSGEIKSDAREKNCGDEKESSNALCTLKGMDENGFDLESGRTWIYPTNYPVRDYQFNIVEQALFKNTLVSLPTGLGKTFIAAVVMYNFYRWYPQGKILFLAPTRPLVAQQIDSCYKVMGIPKEDATEMTGQTLAKDREVLWKRCRLFFLTPQSLLSDLTRSTCPVHNIRCIVVDEAHKATGNYAYCQVIRAILPFNRQFRVLALSATPGSDMTAVQQVVRNLLIEHIEVRDEQSSDTAEFTNQRIVETIVVKLQGFHKDVQERYYTVLDVYTKQLVKLKLLYTSIKNTSKYTLILARKKFRDCPPPGLSRATCSQVESDFAVCISLYHGLELLSQHGLRNLLLYLTGLMEESDGPQSYVRARLRNCTALTTLIEDLREKLGDSVIREPDPDQSINEGQTQTVRVCSHPKMEKLRDVVQQHFLTWQTRNEATRVMVFCQYRDTVIEACHILSELRPLVKVMSFVGQASGKMKKGFSQKQQLRVMTKFRQGGYNTLVSTCVGEEGLDIGEVDLIVCYEAHASPVRLVQRMGRTGRQRQGQIVMLLTEGKETKKYHQSVCNRKSMNNGLVNSHSVLQLEANSPRMIPMELNPQCYKMHMVIPKAVNKGCNRDVRKMFADKINSKAKAASAAATSVAEEEEDLTNTVTLSLPLLPEPEFLHTLGPGELQAALNTAAPPTELTLELDQALQEGAPQLVSRSPAAELLLQLLHTAASKRCNVPQTQTAGLASQLCRKDLWPQKKRRKASLESRGPHKKKRKLHETANAADPKPVQKQLTSLWSTVGQSDSDLMPPPLPALPRTSADGMEVEDLWMQEEEGGVEVDDDLQLEHSGAQVQPLVSCDQVRSSPKSEAVALDQDWSLIEQLASGLQLLEASQPSASCPLRCSQLVSLVTASPISSHRGVLCRLKIVTDNLPDVDVLSSLFNTTHLESIVSPRESNKFSIQENTLDPAIGHLLDDDMDFKFLSDSGVTKEKAEDWEKFPGEADSNHTAEKEFDLGLTQLLAPSPEPNKENSLLLPNCHERKSNLREINSSRPSKSQRENSETGRRKEHPIIETTSKADLFSGDISDFIDEAMLLWLQSPGKAVPEEDTGQDMGHKSPSAGSPILGSQKDRGCARAVCKSEMRMKVTTGKLQSEDEKKAPTLQEVKVSKVSEVIGNLSAENRTETSKELVTEIETMPLLGWEEWTSNNACVSPILGSQTRQNESPTVRNNCPTGLAVNRQSNTFSNITTPKVCRRNLSLGFSAGRRESTKMANNSSESKPSLEDEQKLNHNGSSFPKCDTSNELASLSDNETNSLNDFMVEQPVGFHPKTKRKQSGKEDRKGKFETKRGAVKGQIYIQKEAEESFEDRRASSDEENTSGLDEYDSSFVDDEEEEKSNNQAQDSVDIQAQYLQSVKSPLNQPGQFKLKPLDNVPMDVYSQALTAEELNESYEEDSFCVDGSPEHSQEEVEQDTLDVLEAVLKRKRRRNSSFHTGESACVKENHGGKERPRDHLSSSESGMKAKERCKRKRIRVVSSSSDEERPILEPSQVCRSRNRDIQANGELYKNTLSMKSLKAGVPSTMRECMDAQNIRRTTDNKTAVCSSDLTNTRVVATSEACSSKITPLLQSHQSITEQHETAPAATDKLVVIASSRHVSSAPEIITALKSKHEMVVVVRAVRTGHYIVSRQVAVLRVTFSDLCRPNGWAALQELVQEMRNSFLCPYVLVETPVPTDQNSRVWPAHASEHSASLRTVLRAQVLYSTGCDLSASLIAKLCHREKTEGRGITMPVSLKSIDVMLQFLEALPGVNPALALDIIFKYRSITTFLSRCSSVGSIQEALGISREVARELFFLLSDVCV